MEKLNTVLNRLGLRSSNDDDFGGSGGGGVVEGRGRRSTQSTPRLDRAHRVYQEDKEIIGSGLREQRRSCGSSVSSVECSRVHPAATSSNPKAVTLNRSWETDGTDPSPIATSVDKAWEAGRQKGQELLQQQQQTRDLEEAINKRGREKKRSQSSKKSTAKIVSMTTSKPVGECDIRATSSSPNRTLTQSKSRQRSTTAVKAVHQQQQQTAEVVDSGGKKAAKAARAEDLQAARRQEKLAQAQIQSEMARQKSEGHMRKGLMKELDRERVLRSELERRLQEVYAENQSYHLHLVAMQQEYRRMEEVVHSLLQYRSRVERLQDERKNMVIKYENLIQKQKTQLSNLEDENKLLQAEVRKMESQTPLQAISLKPTGDVAPHCDDGEKSKMLLERLKMLEMEKSGLVLENESLQLQYDHCLDDIANQVISALLAQKALREECLRLQKQVTSLEDDNMQLRSKQSTCTSPTSLTQLVGNKGSDLRVSPNKDILGSCDTASVNFGSLYSMWSTSQEHCDQFPGVPRLSSPPPWIKERLAQAKPASPSLMSVAHSSAGHSSTVDSSAPAADADSGVALDTSSTSADSGTRTSGTQSSIETEFPAENASPRMKHIGLLQQHHFQLVSQFAAPKLNTNCSPLLGSSGHKALTVTSGNGLDKNSSGLLPNKDDMLYSSLSKRPSSYVYSLTSMMSLNDLLDRGANKSGGCDDTFSMIDVDIDIDSREDCTDVSDHESHDRIENKSACSSKHLECDSEDTEHSADVTIRDDDDSTSDRHEDEVFASREQGLSRPRSTSDVGNLKLASSVSECQRLGCDDSSLKALLATARSQRTRSDDNLLRTTTRNSSKQPRNAKSGSELRKFFAKVRLSFHSKSPPKVDSNEKESEKQPTRKQKFHLFRRSSSSASSTRKSKTSNLMPSKTDTPVAANQKIPVSTSVDTGRGILVDRSCSNPTTPAKFSGDRVTRGATASLITVRRSLQSPERPSPVVAAESLEHVVPCESDRSFCSGTLTPESVTDTRQRSLSCSLPKPDAPLRMTLMRLSMSMTDIDRFISRRQISQQQTVSSLLAFHARLQNWWQCYRVSNKAPREHSGRLCSPDILNDTPDVKWMKWNSDMQGDAGRARKISERHQRRE